MLCDSLTYLCPLLPVEHRPSTTPHHCTLFWAALVIPVQLVPCCFRSASVYRLHLLWGWPLFLFPCRFQVRACLQSAHHFRSSVPVHVSPWCPFSPWHPFRSWRRNLPSVWLCPLLLFYLTLLVVVVRSHLSSLPPHHWWEHSTGWCSVWCLSSWW